MSSQPNTPSPSRLLVLISGNGSNLQALIDACNTPALPHTSITRVISNRKDAYGLQRAQKANIPTTYHNLVKYKKRHPATDAGVQAAREEYDLDLARLIVDDERPDLVVCAGFMHVLSAHFCTLLAEAGVDVINLHPALPGRYNGAGAIDRAFEDFQEGEISGTGVMIHYVFAEVDMGEPVVVRDVAMRAGEEKGELEARMHEVEHELIVEGTRVALENIGERRKREEGGGETG
jgi:phosphoribosylglycinamide formyltransferase